MQSTGAVLCVRVVRAARARIMMSHVIDVNVADAAPVLYSYPGEFEVLERHLFQFNSQTGATRPTIATDTPHARLSLSVGERGIILVR